METLNKFKTTTWYRSHLEVWESITSHTAKSLFLYWTYLHLLLLLSHIPSSACFCFWVWELHWISLFPIQVPEANSFPSPNSLLSPSGDLVFLYVIKTQNSQASLWLGYGWSTQCGGSALSRHSMLLVGWLEKACASVGTQFLHPASLYQLLGLSPLPGTGPFWMPGIKQRSHEKLWVYKRVFIIGAIANKEPLDKTVFQSKVPYSSSYTPSR